MKITVTWRRWRDGQHTRQIDLPKIQSGYISKRALHKFTALLKEIAGKKVRIDYEQ